MSKISLSEDVWEKVLKGEVKGRNFQGNYYIIKQKKEEKPTKNEVLLKNGSIGLPANLNQEYELKQPDKKKRKITRKVDPSVLQYLTQ